MISHPTPSDLVQPTPDIGTIKVLQAAMGDQKDVLNEIFLVCVGSTHGPNPATHIVKPLRVNQVEVLVIRHRRSLDARVQRPIGIERLSDHACIRGSRHGTLRTNRYVLAKFGLFTNTPSGERVVVQRGRIPSFRAQTSFVFAWVSRQTLVLSCLPAWGPLPRADRPNSR